MPVNVQSIPVTQKHLEGLRGSALKHEHYTLPQAACTTWLSRTRKASSVGAYAGPSAEARAHNATQNRVREGSGFAPFPVKPYTHVKMIPATTKRKLRTQIKKKKGREWNKMVSSIPPFPISLCVSALIP